MENNPETSGINQYYDMYTETSTTSIVSKGFTVAFATECLQLLYDLRWMILLAFILIIADFWFGMNASKLKGIPIRKSRAGRRTFNKIIDYICYLLMGAVLGKAIGEPYGLDPLVVSITVLVVMLWIRSGFYLWSYMYITRSRKEIQYLEDTLVYSNLEVQ